jgi:hypothetical protein
VPIDVIDDGSANLRRLTTALALCASNVSTRQHSDELHRHDQRDHGKRRERRSARSPMPERQGRLRHRLERHRRRRHRRRVPAANDDSRAPVRLAAHVAVRRRAAALDGTLHSTSSRRVLKRFAAAGSSPVPQQSAVGRLSLVLYWLCECDTTISVKARHQMAMLSKAAVHRLESLLKQNGATATTPKASVRAVLAMLLAPAPASIADLCNRTKAFGNALLTNRSPLAHTVAWSAQFDLHATAVIEAAGELLAVDPACAAHPTLRTLNLARNAIDDAALEQLISGRGILTLSELDISGNRLQHRSAERLCTLLTNSMPSTLEILRVDDNESLFDGDGTGVLLDAAVRRLRVFEAANCGLTEVHCAALQSVVDGEQRPSRLESLILNRNRVGAQISVVARFPSLRALYLQSCSIQFETLSSLGTQISFFDVFCLVSLKLGN